MAFLRPFFFRTCRAQRIKSPEEEKRGDDDNLSLSDPVFLPELIADLLQFFGGRIL